MIMRLLKFLKPSPYKIIGVLLILFIPILAQWSQNESLSVMEQFGAFMPPNYAAAMARVNEMNKAMEAMQPQIVVLKKDVGSINNMATVMEATGWTVAVICAYVVSCLLVERPRLELHCPTLNTSQSAD